MVDQITLAITHYNRFDMLCESFAQVADDPRINEIVISDDASDDGSWGQICDRFALHSKVHAYQNPTNLDCYRNKAQAVRRSRHPWVLLFDSDNVLTPEYLDALFAVAPWDRRQAYLPTFAAPTFDYRSFAGVTVDRSTVAQYVRRGNFTTALNTANHFFARDEYLRVWDSAVSPGTADSIYMNYRWLEGGNALTFVPGMHYLHRVHDGSHYVQKHTREMWDFGQELERRLEELT